MKPEEIIAAYELSPHPEGGWYRECHRSPRMIVDPSADPEPRPALTAIYFLLTEEAFSAFHSLRNEEVWVHLAGAPLEIVLLDRKPRRLRLAPAEDGGPPQAVVPGGTIQGARTRGSHTLVACLVAPGFDFKDLSVRRREDLLREFPEHADLVRELTR